MPKTVFVSKSRRKSSLETSRLGASMSLCDREPDISHILTPDQCEFALKTFCDEQPNPETSFKTPLNKVTRKSNRKRCNPAKTENLKSKAEPGSTTESDGLSSKPEQVGFNKFNFGEKSINPNIQNTTGNLTKTQVNNLTGTPPKNLRKLSKDYTPEKKRKL